MLSPGDWLDPDLLIQSSDRPQSYLAAFAPPPFSPFRAQTGSPDSAMAFNVRLVYLELYLC
jgi:hypothetical protein